MDLNKLKRNDSIRGVADRVTGVVDNVVEAVTKAAEEFVEQQQGHKQGKIAETLGERDKLEAQACDINTLFSRISGEEPIIVVGKLDDHAGSHVAAVVSTQFSQVRSGHEGDEDLPYITFYKVSETELLNLQEAPLKRSHEVDGVVVIGEYLHGESVLGWARSERMENGIGHETSPILDQALSPLGSIAVALEAGFARRGLHDFGQSLDMLRSAMFNRELNPHLAELLSRPASGPDAGSSA